MKKKGDRMDLYLFTVFLAIIVIFTILKSRFFVNVISGMLFVVSGLFIYLNGLTRTEAFLNSAGEIVTKEITIVAPQSTEAFILLIVLALGGVGLLYLTK
jgi:hypothetical protein